MTSSSSASTSSLSSPGSHCPPALIAAELDDDMSAVSAITESTLYRGEQLPQQSIHGKEKMNYMNKNAGDSPKLLMVPTSHRRHVSTSDIPTKEETKKSNNSAVVSFGGGIQVRYYERVLDVNPSVSNGAPIGIGWNYFQDEGIPVEEWELLKKQYAPAKRSSDRLKLSKREREQLLRESGYRSFEIAAAVRSVLKAQHQRAQTVHNLNNAQFEEAIENAARKVRKVLSKGLFRFSSSSNKHPTTLQAYV